jgi:hypothetical protein
MEILTLVSECIRMVITGMANTGRKLSAYAAMRFNLFDPCKNKKDLELSGSFDLFD